MANGLGSKQRNIRILSIDGGGIRGIVPAGILAEIERRTAKPISTLFDLLAGTSTGGILVLAMVRPDGAKQAAHSANDMIEFYERLGPAIFSKSLAQFLGSADGLIRSKYSDGPIENALQDFFGSSRLSDALTSVFVPSYELRQRTPFFFRSVRAKQDPEFDYPMHTVARSTSAAPTYFPPESISTPGTNQNYVMIDGGVFANNPAACALVEARVQFPQAEDFTLVSLGTGALKEPSLMTTTRNWGMAQWARPILDTVLDGVSSTVDYQMAQLLGAREDGTQRYYRFQPALSSSGQTMDNAAPEALKALQAITASLVEQRSSDIDGLCERLVS
jgi:patatin-like phospholipase/acyl hydrolase